MRKLLILKEYIKTAIYNLHEGAPGERGLAYENALTSVLNANSRPRRFEVAEGAGNNSSISDLDMTIDGDIGVAFEVKLSFDDLLGKVRKKHFESLVWDGNKFLGKPLPGSPIGDAVKAILKAMNKSNDAKTKIKKMEQYVIPFKPLPWDLMSTFGNDGGSPNDKKLYSVMRNKPEEFPLPRGYQGVPSKQITTGDEIQISASDIRKIISGKNGALGNPTYYIIVGNNSPQPAGQIFSLGIGDPLHLNAPLFDPGVVGVELRFQGSGGESGPGRRFSFGLDTRGGGEHGAGILFGGKNLPLDKVLLSGLKRKRK